MKKFGLFLVGCLGFVGLYGAHANNLDDAVRAAVRRGTNTSTVTTRTKTPTPQSTTTTRQQTSRVANVINRNATTARTTNTVNRSATTGVTANVVPRGTTSVVPRTKDGDTTTTRAPQSTTTRTTARTTTTRNSARAATATREDILTRNYSKCKTIFNECMDEFCANKDSQLKRCACSSRINEFNNIKKQLDNIDEKMLDFNQRLLTVSMDKDDVAALNIATDGETAFYDTTDTSQSKRTLDAIAKKLNTSFDSSNFSTTLGGALSWSLDLDSAFDSVDSLKGASTAAKSGVALYSAALPICREMATEVCSPEDLAIAESGYQVLITQDCNTIEKTYKSATDQAKTKVLESSALLDMSRLNVYQTNNADDVLTCKAKMLAMLTNSTVCGPDLEKCLDVTGQYIDPSTGEAFLSADLADLGNLITRPTGDETWSNSSKNATFVQFLNSKKKFLEPAMEHCVDIADTVWDAFVEDALSQIKIAQMRKLEDVRQSCTTLTAQCLTNAIESITDFDARALSIFGVAADATANAMCENVLSSCTTLLNTTDTDMEWHTGMTGIQTDITYDTIKNTCREVGRACVIQVCTSTSGNFGLCENISTSINRKSIINRTACWDEVLNCVASAGEDALKNIYTQNKLYDDNTYVFYNDLYGLSSPTIVHTDDGTSTDCVTSTEDLCIYDICYDKCGESAYTDTHECRVCRLAESIWGNCESAPSTLLDATESHNRIRVPANNTTTILSWFATNTNTSTANDSCRDTTCGIGFYAQLDSDKNTTICLDSADRQDDCKTCNTNSVINATSNITNCCDGTATDSHGNCCNNGTVADDTLSICIPSNATHVATFTVTTADGYYPTGTYNLVCAGTISNTENTVTCSGRFFVVANDASLYIDPKYSDTEPSTKFVTQSFSSECTKSKPITYTYTNSNNAWTWTNGSETFNSTVDKWKVSYNTGNL